MSIMLICRTEYVYFKAHALILIFFVNFDQEYKLCKNSIYVFSMHILLNILNNSLHPVTITRNLLFYINDIISEFSIILIQQLNLEHLYYLYYYIYIILYIIIYIIYTIIIYTVC